MLKFFILLLSISLLIISCGQHVERIGYSLSKKNDTSNCNIKVDYNNYLLPKSSSIGTYIFDGSLFSSNCSKEIFLDTIRKEACFLGANLVNIYNINEPDIFNPCYNASADFYKFSDDSLKSFETVDSTKNYISIEYLNLKKDDIQGIPFIELLGSFGYDFHTGDFNSLINDNSYITFNSSDFPASGMDLGLEGNLWFGRLGLNVGYNYVITAGSYSTSAYGNSNSSFSVCNEGIFKLGLAFQVFSTHNPNANPQKIFVRGGYNHTNFSFGKKEFFNDITGDGSGYYAEAGFTWQITKEFIANGILGYKATNINFSEYDKTYAIGKIYLGATFGFQFLR